MKKGELKMEALQISGMWYAVRWHDDSKQAFTIIDGPYPEEWQAVSHCRLREI